MFVQRILTKEALRQFAQMLEQEIQRENAERSLAVLADLQRELLLCYFGLMSQDRRRGLLMQARQMVD
jgi:hypothetical protein